MSYQKIIYNNQSTNTMFNEVEFTKLISRVNFLENKLTKLEDRLKRPFDHRLSKIIKEMGYEKYLPKFEKEEYTFEDIYDIIKEGDEENEMSKIFTTGGSKRKFKKDFKQYLKNLKKSKVKGQSKMEEEVEFNFDDVEFVNN